MLLFLFGEMVVVTFTVTTIPLIMVLMMTAIL